MVDRPIIFSAPMIQALLDGRKTQTRRKAWRTWTEHRGRFDAGLTPSPRQKAKPGDRLWVREAWGLHVQDIGDVRQERWPLYRADGGDRRPSDNGGDMPWRPSIHMPRWASRLTLTVTEVRVQRLQEISCADAIREGIHPAANSQTIDCDTPDPRDEFRTLWGSLHGPGAWDANPEVVAISFRCERRNIDAIEVASGEGADGPAAATVAPDAPL